jgi:ADP-ribosyl-[dinitrogen reductase] hydrolase
MEFPPPDSRILPDQILCTSPPLSNQPSKEQERIVGSLVGLAVGDALGASVEFRPRQYLVDHPVTDMQSGGTWGLQAGQWTDDTSMALCLASSLITQHGFNPYDQMVRYKWWYKQGFLSSTGKCFDIGSTTRSSLEEFCRRQSVLKQHFKIAKDEDIDNLPFDQVRSVKNFNVVCGQPEQAGNGALMRLAPVPLFYFRQPNQAVELAGESARLTHGDEKAVDSCRYYAALIVAAVRGEPKEELLNDQFYEKHQQWFGSRKLHGEVLKIARGSYKKEGGYEDGIRGKNYIVNTLEAALWAFWSDKNDFEEGVLRAVNLGDDTDTTAAVYGQLAGACYGVSAINRHWAQQLYARDLLICIGEWLYYEGGQNRNNTAQQPQQSQQRMTQQPQQSQQRMTQQPQQPQQRMTQPPPNQSRMHPSQFNQHNSSYPSTQQNSTPVSSDRLGYGISAQTKSSHHAGTQPSYQAQPNNNSNVSRLPREKPKLDPSKMPPAGLKSGSLN